MKFTVLKLSDLFFVNPYLSQTEIFPLRSWTIVCFTTLLFLFVIQSVFLETVDYSGWTKTRFVVETVRSEERLTSLKSSLMETDKKYENDSSLVEVLYDKLASQPQSLSNLLNLFAEDHRNRFKVLMFLFFVKISNFLLFVSGMQTG
jgi:hypothetical protein